MQLLLSEKKKIKKKINRQTNPLFAQPVSFCEFFWQGNLFSGKCLLYKKVYLVYLYWSKYTDKIFLV